MKADLIVNAGSPVEYLRRSVERDKQVADKDKGAQQRADNAAQASRDGGIIARTFDGDWGISGGRDKRDKREAMKDLIAAIKRGEVSAIYVHTTDRLARDVEYGMTLWNACKDAGTLIRPGAQRFDPRAPGMLQWWVNILAQAEEDLDRMTRKTQDVQDWLGDHADTCKLPGRPHRGRCHLIGCLDTTHCKYAHRRGRRRYGELPGESVAKVLETFDAIGSFLGTAKALTKEHWPTREGGDWDVKTVSTIVRRARPAMPKRLRQGVRAKSTRLFSGLLTCPCGATMSSMPRPGGRQIGYYCPAAHRNTEHSRPYVVSEAKIRPWAEAQVLTLRTLDPAGFGPAPEDADKLTKRLAIIDARVVRVRDMFEHSEIDRPELVRRLALIERERATLDTTAKLRTIRIVGLIDWTDEPGAVNAKLRTLWQHVILGRDLLPRRAVWQPTEEYGAEGPTG